MLFNSYNFLFLFLPLVLAGYYFLGRKYSLNTALSWVLIVSLLFYAWGEPYYTLILIASFTLNFFIGQALMASKLYKKPILIIGIVLNLGLLGFFKYSYFILDAFNLAAGTDIKPLWNIILPLGISFYTFHQIRWLVDLYKGTTTEYSYLRYALFVSFFPQLIAGPIVNHKDMMPQFDNPGIFKNLSANLSLGITVFIVGLFKKVVLADGMAVYASPIFNAADAGYSPHFLEAWVGAASYTFQLYFDFSGYSDMAVGLGIMFGIRLPVNFLSPYKATNIQEFWRRWHITLTRFLRDYVYIPLGGNRKGAFVQCRNLVITMFLCGLWHGAGWTFVFWGLFHGFLMVLYHIWAKLTPWSIKEAVTYKVAAHVLTLLVVIGGWVVFRSETFDGAVEIFRGMVGLNGFILPGQLIFLEPYISAQFANPTGFWMKGDFSEEYAMLFIGLCYLITISFPNIYDVLEKAESFQSIERNNSLELYIMRHKEAITAVILAFMAYFSISLFGEYSEFIYFRF